MSTIRITTFAAMLAVAAATAASVPVASAKDGRDVRVAGTCTHVSTAKLKLSPEDERIEVEFEVDQNRNGVPWRVTLRRNGVLVAATTATTRAPSGSFSVRRVVAGTRAARVTAIATRASGERCTASAAF
jgi:hypothetical protein